MPFIKTHDNNNVKKLAICKTRAVMKIMSYKKKKKNKYIKDIEIRPCIKVTKQKIRHNVPV